MGGLGRANAVRLEDVITGSGRDAYGEQQPPAAERGSSDQRTVTDHCHEAMGSATLPDTWKRKSVGDRTYSVGVTAALVALSQGACYFPNCRIPTVVLVEGEPVLNLQRAHIIPVKESGPRGNSSDRSRLNHFENLILLCTPHHLLVDKLRVEDYGPDVLIGWKQDREGSGLMALNALGGLTEERLQEVLSDTVGSQLKKVDDALARLEEYDREAAQLLREILGRLDDAWFGGYISLDALADLTDASFRLHRSLNEDVVGELARSARLLADLNIAEVADNLLEAARRFRDSM